MVSTRGLTGTATALGGVGRGLTGLGNGLGVGFGDGFGAGLGALVGAGGCTGGALLATGGAPAALGTASAVAPGVAAPVITGTEVLCGGVAGLTLVTAGDTAARVTLTETSCMRRSFLLKRLPGMPRLGKSNLIAKMRACSSSEISSACFKSKRKRQRRQARPRVRFLDWTGLSDLTVDGI
jgi:hypothetical protein